MNDSYPTRPNYFTGEALLTADFICEQHYQMDSLARLNRSLHTYGIATGLEVYWQVGDQANQVQVQPGMAIDGEGRQIVLPQPQVVTFSGIQQGAMYYLTIRYHEAFDDLTAESGVLGYKRVVQQPEIRYGRTLQDPALNILLAVVNFSAQGQISALAYRSGAYERRYVGSVSGSLNLVTEGSGINGGPDAVTFTRQTLPSHITLSSRKELDGLGGDYLDVAAERAEFSGQLTTRGNIGIGALHPEANLQVEGIVFRGPGTLTTSGTLLTLSQPISPPLQPGDLVIPQIPVGAAARVPVQVAIAGTTTSPVQYVISPAFKPDINQLSPYPYTFVRATLARFWSPQSGTVFSVGNDGSVGLGVMAAGSTTGPNALTITPQGQVRIGLTGSVAQANLQVSGQILTDALVCNGALTAQSFAGNGSNLTDLNFVSDWTRQNVSASNTALYYLPGNVGVRMTNPPGALSVGTGPQRIGSGLITSDPKTPGLLHGFQTLFTQEVAIGDSITVGDLIPQMQQIARIISDTELQLQDQFPLVVQESAYKTIPGDSKGLPGQGQPIILPEDAARPRPTADPTPGPGTISTVGTQVKGNGTSFTSLAVGDYLVIDKFIPNPGDVATWLVQTITDDATLTLTVPSGQQGATFPANASAYVIGTALLAIFQGNGEGSGQPPELPAMLIVDNGPTAASGTTQAPNTVAINLPLNSVDSTYALQVNGAVNFSGNTHIDHLTVETLVATTSIAVTGDGTANLLLAVGEGTSNPLLAVTKTNVLVGNGNPSGAQLDVGADIHAGGNVGATGNVTAGGTVTGGNVTATGTVQGASLTGSALGVSGVSIFADGSVALMGARTSFTQQDLDGQGTLSRHAATDGTVIAILGTPDDKLSTNFAGMMHAQTSANKILNSLMYSAALTLPYYIPPSGKKSHGTTLWLPIFGQITLPVLKGEDWSLTVTYPPSDVKFANANLQVYWIPSGPQSPPPSLAGGVSPPAPPPGAAARAEGEAAPNHLNELRATLTSLHDRMSSGEFVRNALTLSQETIDQRVGDLTKVLGDATGMSPDPEARAAFVRDLQNIVCSAVPPERAATGGDNEAHIAALLDTAAQLVRREFSAEQKALLSEGVRALVEINANEQNRQDLDLIKTNINRFLDNTGEVLGRPFDTGQRRILTRALVRLVGDGSQSPPRIGELPSIAVPPPAADAGQPPDHSGPIEQFFQELETTLVQPLEDQSGLRQLIEQVIEQKPPQETAQAMIVDAVKAAAAVPLNGGRQGMITSLVQRLLRLLR